MRETIFRGKRIDNGEWVYGWLRQTGHQDIEKPNGQYIRTEKYYQIQDKEYNSQFVDEATVGQYTGLKDKKGNKIFDGDIIQYEDICKGLVKYSEKYAQYVLIQTGQIADEYESLGDYNMEVHKVIGNIHDNPELLEEEE